MNQKVILVLSLLVGILAFGLSIQYFQSQQAELDRARAEFEQRVRKIEIIVAARDIPEGLVLDKADIAKSFRYQSELSAREDEVLPQEAAYLLGRKTIFKLKKGDAITWSYLEGGGRAAPGLAAAVTPGMRAVSLAIGGASAVSEMVAPNDSIDVLGTFSFPSKTVAGEMETVTLTVLQDVTVLATGRRLANESPALQRASQQSGYSAVTLEVTPREAELLVFAQQLKGRLTLTLRNASDVSFEKDLPSVDFNRLEERLPEMNLYRQRNIRHKTNL